MYITIILQAIGQLPDLGSAFLLCSMTTSSLFRTKHSEDVLQMGKNNSILYPSFFRCDLSLEEWSAEEIQDSSCIPIVGWNAWNKNIQES